MGKKVITSNLSKLSQAHQRNAKRLPLAVAKGFSEIADESIGLYRKTTRTWKKQPAFYAERTTRGVIIKTDSEIYGWVDEGTKPHKIPKQPKTDRDAKPFLVFGWPYKAATKPRVINSFRASTGNKLAFKRQVKHPGIKARNFTDEIAKRMQKRATAIMRRQINEAIRVESAR